MRLKFLYPLHILFATFSIIWATLALVMPNKSNLDYRFLLLLNIVLWFITCLPAYMFYKGLQTKRTSPTLNAISGSVMIKLLGIVSFILLYHVFAGGTPTSSLLIGVIIYLVYSFIHVKVMTNLNKK